MFQAFIYPGIDLFTQRLGENMKSPRRLEEASQGTGPLQLLRTLDEQPQTN